MKPQQKTKLSISILLLTVCFFLIGNQQIYSQTTNPVIMAQINAELQKRGLSEGEVRTRLLQKGIDLETILPSDLPKYQSRVMIILDEMEAEKKAATVNIQKTLSSGVTESVVPITVVPITTKEEAAAEAAQKVVQVAVAKEPGPTQIYGHSLFTDQSLEVFRTTDGAFAPETYVLGAGDEIRITIFGASQTDMQFKINTEGYIQPSGMPKVFLQGLTLQQARNLLFQRLSGSYSFRADQYALTISTARTIMVNVFGETKFSGGFNLSALNSAFNALSAAGGPTNIGSVRAIQLIRGKDRKTLDLYAFMSNPAIQYQFDLQQNDIIYVPIAQSLVSIEGAVIRPMRYEMLPLETLSDLIRFAGGVNVNVYPDFVQIQRYVDGELRLKEWNLADVLSGKTKVNLQNGDVVRIKAISKPIEQFVEIKGSVYYPGKYDLTSNPTVGSLLNKAQPTTQAKTDLIILERTRPDETIEILTIPWSELQNSEKDVNLQPLDRIEVLTLANYRDVGKISVSGNVRIPFEKTLSMNDKLTVKQAIELAGGLQKTAYPIAYVFRSDLYNPGNIKYIRIELEKSNDFNLQAGDMLNVYDNSMFANIGEVRIFGAVKQAKEFTFDASLTMQNIFTAAGGFALGAALNRVEVFRTILSPTEKSRLTMITLEMDSSFHVTKPANFILQPYDQIVVRQTPAFTMGHFVEISGEVNYPGRYALKTNRVHLSEIIKMAGGLLGTADARGSRLFRTYNNRGEITLDINKAMRKKMKVRHDPILFEGDVITINRRENTVAIREAGTRLMDFSSITTSDGKLNVVYQGQKSARWYINNYAGGFNKDADKNSVTVVLKNGQVKTTKKPLYIFRNYPDVETGSSISMLQKPPKEKLNCENKTDWDGLWMKTLTMVSTTLTIVVLLQSVK